MLRRFMIANLVRLASFVGLLGMVASAAVAEIRVEQVYARASSPAAKSGAAYFRILNTGPDDDRLIGVSTPFAAKAALHSQSEDAMGVMKMLPLTGGLDLPVGQEVVLGRGGDHVMLMGLSGAMQQGTRFPMTLTFRHAAPLTVDVGVDMEGDMTGGGMGMGK